MGDKRTRKIIFLLMAAGLFLRFCYIVATPYNISPHDLGVFTNSSAISGGHLGYTNYLLQYHQLPDFDPRTVGAFYNPPFYYIVSVVWIKLLSVFSVDPLNAVSALRFLTLGYVTVSVYLVVKILEEFHIKGRMLILLSAFASFFPTFIWLAGTLSTDSLALLWMLLACLYSLRWYRLPTIRHILVVAFAIGLGMMTKLNAGFVAFGTAFLFLLRLKETGQKDRQNIAVYLKQFVLFGIVCVPLGLYWPLRNAVLFQMPLNYIPVAVGTQYIGTASVWSRLGIPRIAQLVYPRVHFDTMLDTNIWLTMIRTALFDEQQMMGFSHLFFKVLAVLFLWLSILLAISMTGCMIVALLKKNSNLSKCLRGYIALSYFPLLLGYLIFCFQYPHICTMNYRYITFLTIFPLIGTGILLSQETIRNNRITLLFNIAVILFCATSALLYLQYCVGLFLGKII